MLKGKVRKYLVADIELCVRSAEIDAVKNMFIDIWPEDHVLLLFEATFKHQANATNTDGGEWYDFRFKCGRTNELCSLLSL